MAKYLYLPVYTGHIREAAPNVVKNTHFFCDNFVSIALIPVKLQSNKLKCGQFRFKARNQPVIQVMIIRLELYSEYLFVVNQFLMLSR